MQKNKNKMVCVIFKNSGGATVPPQLHVAPPLSKTTELKH